MLQSNNKSPLSTIFFKNAADDFGGGERFDAEKARTAAPQMIEIINYVLELGEYIEFEPIDDSHVVQDIYGLPFTQKPGGNPQCYRADLDKYIIEATYSQPYKKTDLPSYAAEMVFSIYKAAEGYAKAGRMTVQLAPNAAPVLRITTNDQDRLVGFVDLVDSNSRAIKDGIRQLVVLIENKLPTAQWVREFEGKYKMLGSGIILGRTLQ